MMRPNIKNGSSRASLRMLGSEEEVLGPIHEHVQGRRREHGGRLPENDAVGYAGDGGKNHVAPVGQGLGSVVEVCAAENEGGGKKCAGIRTEAQHEQVLDERAEEDLPRQRGAGENEAYGGDYAARRLCGKVRRRNESDGNTDRKSTRL